MKYFLVLKRNQSKFDQVSQFSKTSPGKKKMLIGSWKKCRCTFKSLMIIKSFIVIRGSTYAPFFLPYMFSLLFRFLLSHPLYQSYIITFSPTPLSAHVCSPPSCLYSLTISTFPLSILLTFSSLIFLPSQSHSLTHSHLSPLLSHSQLRFM